MQESRRAERDSIGLRLKLATTIASVALFLAVVVGGLFVSASQAAQDGMERQILRNATSAAVQLVNTYRNGQGHQTGSVTSAGFRRGLASICRIFSVGMATIPDFEIDKAGSTLGELRTIPTSVFSSPIVGEGYQFGDQTSLQVQSLIHNRTLSNLCPNGFAAPKPINVAYISPIGLGGTRGTVDLVVVGSQETYFGALVDSNAAFLLSILTLVLAASIGIFLALRQIRQAMLGLTPSQLSAVIEEQQALLQGISEGVIGCDGNGRIRFYNDEAQRILNLPRSSQGRPIGVLVRGSRLRGVLTGQIEGRDLPVVVGESVLIINRIVVSREGDDLGYVITLRDQTEWEGLLKELDSLVGMTETLRAQAHEFRNKLHIIIGLIEIGRPEEAVAFATDVSVAQDRVSAKLSGIGDPMVEALLRAKMAAAAERSVDLIVDDDSKLDEKLNSPAEILSVLGNLIDNGIDAASNGILQLGWETGDRGWVVVKLRNEGSELQLEVSDSGSGIPAEIREDIFTDGFSTKVSRHGARRGLGLAIVHQVVTRAAGTIGFTNQPGASFQITIPSAVGEIEQPIARLRRSMTTDAKRG